MARRLRHLLIALILSCFYNRKNTLKTYMVMADDTFSSNPEGSGHSNLESTAPLKHPPIDMISAFTMNNTIPIEYYYVDDTNRTAGMSAFPYGDGLILSAQRPSRLLRLFYHDDLFYMLKNTLLTVCI